MISKILVASDGSETANKAVEYAAQLAKQIGSTIILLSVVHKSPFVAQAVSDEASPTHLVETIEDYFKQAAEAYLGEAERVCEAKGVQSKKVFRSGHPVEEIIKGAEESQADLVVMGSHGTSALKAALLGSVTFGVIHKDTKIPVLIVRK